MLFVISTKFKFLSFSSANPLITLEKSRYSAAYFQWTTRLEIHLICDIVDHK